MNPADEIGHLADVLIDLEVELDRKMLSVREILNLDVGTVIRMIRSAGENIDILIDRHVVGFGEIVIIEDAMGIRITDFRGED
ncbi:MAG: FliM/FliN family flagellar motor switch protein [Bryobacteraceae bacterium]